MLSAKQTRCNNHTCAKHHENKNGNVVSYCKHKRKKYSTCTAKIKTTGNGDIISLDEHRKMYTMEVTDISDKVLDYTKITICIVDGYAIQYPQLTPKQVWSHIKKALDEKSNDSWI